MLRRSLIAGVIAIACGVFSTHAQQASQPAQTPAPQGAASGTTPARRPPAAADSSGGRCRSRRGHDFRRRAEGVHEPVLRGLPQRAGQGRWHGLGAQAGGGRARPGQPRARRQDVGAHRPQAARGHDAAGGNEASRARRVQRHDRLVRAGARRGRRALHAGAGSAPLEPHRIRQRGARPARSRPRRQQVPAERRFDVGLRQHRRRARPVVHAGRGVRRGGAEDQPPGARLSRAAHPGGVPHPRGHVAGLPPGRHAVRDPRRPRRPPPLSVRRRVSAHGDADFRRQHVADRVRLGAVRADRDAARRRAAVARGLGGRRPSVGGQLRAGPSGAARHRVRRPGRARRVLRRPRRRADARALQDHRRHARRRCHVPGHQLRAAARSRQALHARHAADGPDARLHVLPAHRHDPHRGSVPGGAGRRLAEPAQDLRLHAEDRG